MAPSAVARLDKRARDDDMFDADALHERSAVVAQEGGHLSQLPEVGTRAFRGTDSHRDYRLPIIRFRVLTNSRPVTGVS